uniref:Uncharacterized protein n=1 Tax=Pseudomonas fluorescens (strain SBW25) TaxID=216595 RepID=A4V713_PSEFS|nr:hypothetical protein pQBR0292 [Pseudomonas fluorescens SBW25]
MAPPELAKKPLLLSQEPAFDAGSLVLGFRSQAFRTSSSPGLSAPRSIPSNRAPRRIACSAWQASDIWTGRSSPSRGRPAAFRSILIANRNAAALGSRFSSGTVSCFVGAWYFIGACPGPNRLFNNRGFLSFGGPGLS